MPRSPGYRRFQDSKIRIEEALDRKGLKPRDDTSVLNALEQEEVFIAAKTWQRFWEGKQNIHRSTFQKICQFLGLEWQEIVEPRSDSRIGTTQKLGHKSKLSPDNFVRFGGDWQKLIGRTTDKTGKS